MRAETRRAVRRLDNLLADRDFAAMVAADMWMVSAGRCKRNMHLLTVDDINVLRSLLRKLPMAEECLAKGGMVQSCDDKWCRDGDRVSFRMTASADFETGELSYDADLCKWYVMCDREGYFHELGDVYEWFSEENND